MIFTLTLVADNKSLGKKKYVLAKRFISSLEYVYYNLRVTFNRKREQCKPAAIVIAQKVNYF